MPLGKEEKTTYELHEELEQLIEQDGDAASIVELQEELSRRFQTWQEGRQA